MNRILTTLLVLAVALPARAQTGTPPITPPTQACTAGAVALSRGWHDYTVTTANGQDTYAGKAVDCTTFAAQVPAGTPLCKVLGTACPAGTDPVYATKAQLDAVAASVPQPASTVPPAATPTGKAGIAATYVPADAAEPSLTRSARTLTASDGTFAVAWAVPLTSTAPVAPNPAPINAGSQPVICNVLTVTAQGVTGRCWQLTTVSVATLGVSLNMTGGPAGGLTVSVFAREPTQ